MSYKWKPSKSAKKDYAKKMEEIEEFCKVNNISNSRTNDSYYFTLNGVEYRVSNHSIEMSNSKAYNCFGEKIRELYHEEGRKENVVYIHASKTRIIEIYNDLKAGFELDKRGNRIIKD